MAGKTVITQEEGAHQEAATHRNTAPDTEINTGGTIIAKTTHNRTGTTHTTQGHKRHL